MKTKRDPVTMMWRIHCDSELSAMYLTILVHSWTCRWHARHDKVLHQISSPRNISSENKVKEFILYTVNYFSLMVYQILDLLLAFHHIFTNFTYMFHLLSFMVFALKSWSVLFVSYYIRFFCCSLHLLYSGCQNICHV